MQTFDRRARLNLAVRAARVAGKAIMDIYSRPQSQWEVEQKADASPLTLADRRAHRLIAEMLAPTAYPILSEEGTIATFEERKSWERLWIVDPLDGTKEFLKRNGEFTVNIALVEAGVPVEGVVFAPAKGHLYIGSPEGAAKALIPDSEDVDSPAQFLPIPTPKCAPGADEAEPERLRVVASRSHLSVETAEFIGKLKAQHGEVDIVSAGSSLKICLVAEGAADLYPRLAPTMEWDTAAGHAVALAAGCTVVDAQTGQALFYNKADLHNPWFIVSRKPRAES